jgi:oligosaccharide repeat unit polymerase
VSSYQMPDGAVVRPVLLVITILATFFLVLTRGRFEMLQPFEIGAFYATVVAMAACVPVLNYLRADPRAIPGSNWYEGMPPELFASVAWWYAIYLASFTTAYLLVRGRHAAVELNVTAPTRATIVAVATLFLIPKLFFLVLGFAYDLDITTYSDQYLVMRRLPTFAKQFANIAEGWNQTFQILLLAIMFLRYQKWRLVIALFIGGTVVMHLIRPGARTELLMVIVCALMLYDLLVQRLPMRKLIVVTAATLFIYLLIGVLRQRTNDTPVLETMAVSYTDVDTIYINAYQLLYQFRARGVLTSRPDIYWSDLLGFIPQQFLPFPKTTLSLWFVQTYHPYDYEKGGGRAFGIASEAATGYGWIELVWRGGLLGVIFALVQRKLVTKNNSFIYLGFYVWLTVWSYQAYRGTLFMLPTLIIYRYLSAVAAVALLAFVLRRWLSEPATR